MCRDGPLLSCLLASLLDHCWATSTPRNDVGLCLGCGRASRRARLRLVGSVARARGRVVRRVLARMASPVLLCLILHLILSRELMSSEPQPALSREDQRGFRDLSRVATMPGHAWACPGTPRRARLRLLGLGLVSFSRSRSLSRLGEAFTATRI